jgi:hypothetical protein
MSRKGQARVCGGPSDRARYHTKVIAYTLRDEDNGERFDNIRRGR